jgi:hypothetical protein
MCKVQRKTQKEAKAKNLKRHLLQPTTDNPLSPASSTTPTMSRISSLVRATATATTSSIRPASVSAVTSASRFYSVNIRDAGGAFSKKEAAQEDKYVHDHEKEVSWMKPCFGCIYS